MQKKYRIIAIALTVAVLFINGCANATHTNASDMQVENSLPTNETHLHETNVGNETTLPDSTDTETTETIEAPVLETDATESIETEPTIIPTETEPISPESDITFTEVDEIVYANTNVNVRTGPSTDYEKLGSLSFGEEIQRIGIGDNGWSCVIYNGVNAYMYSEYIQTTKPVAYYDTNYPLSYSDATCTITIYREWYENAWCYAAHIVFSDYSRLSTSCANGAYNNGYETTSHAANRLGAILTVNGCYSAPNLNYTVVRDGVIWNGADKNSFWCPAVYSSHTGLLLSAWESGGTPGIAGENINDLVTAGLVTDTFCFGPPFLANGNVSGGNDSRAQRTFIGTNGNPGDIWLVVSDGRYNDGESAGLTGNQCARYLASKGCTFGVPLDGGGSSTMAFQGEVLNAARNNQRAVVDFVYFK